MPDIQPALQMRQHHVHTRVCGYDQNISFHFHFTVFKTKTSFKNESATVPIAFLNVIACLVRMLFRNEAKVFYK